MRVFSLALCSLIGVVMVPGRALCQSAAFPEAPAERPSEALPPPPTPQGQPAPAPKRGPYQQVLGPYQRSPPRDDPKKDERPEYALGDPAGLRTHDGFFFRLAGGLGGMSDSIDGAGSALARNSVTGSSEFAGTASGLAFATEAALGFTPVSSLVIGAGVYTATAPAPESDESGVAGKYEFKLTQLELFALFADYYFDPFSGWHAQAGGGFCAMIMGQGTGKDGG